MMAEHIGCPELYDVMNKDMKVLHGIGMGKKVDWSPTRWFSEVVNAEHVCVYHHLQHAMFFHFFITNTKLHPSS